MPAYDRSEPASDSTVSTSPKEVVIFFSQEVDANTVVIRVLGPDGTQVDLQDAAVDLCDPDRKRATVSLPDVLPAGAYIVQWETMSLEDDERDNGSFSFVIKFPEGSPAASPQATPGASPEASPTNAAVSC